MFGYVGPETVLPVTSVLAAIGGTALIFGQSILRFAQRALQRVTRFRTTAPSNGRGS